MLSKPNLQVPRMKKTHFWCDQKKNILNIVALALPKLLPEGLVFRLHHLWQKRPKKERVKQKANKNQAESVCAWKKTVELKRKTDYSSLLPTLSLERRSIIAVRKPDLESAFPIFCTLWQDKLLSTARFIQQKSNRSKFLPQGNEKSKEKTATAIWKGNFENTEAETGFRRRMFGWPTVRWNSLSREDTHVWDWRQKIGSGDGKMWKNTGLRLSITGEAASVTSIDEWNDSESMKIPGTRVETWFKHSFNISRIRLDQGFSLDLTRIILFDHACSHSWTLDRLIDWLIDWSIDWLIDPVRVWQWITEPNESSRIHSKRHGHVIRYGVKWKRTIMWFHRDICRLCWLTITTLYFLQTHSCFPWSRAVLNFQNIFFPF